MLVPQGRNTAQKAFSMHGEALKIHDYYIVWLHNANTYSSCFISKCVFRSVLERFQITALLQQTMLCEVKSFK